MSSTEHHLRVTKTARYHTLGELNDSTREVWFVCHGYGQLASFFIKHFTGLDDGSRYIVAPEALSRFYLGSPGERVGATWMTREDRLAEIADYVAYLDQIQERVFAVVPREKVTVTVLGFSQGAITASRWLAQGALVADRFIVWGGELPHDLDLDRHADLFRRMRFAVVYGTQDQFVTEEKAAELKNRIDSHAIPVRIVPFDGGHRMNREVLQALAAEL